MKKDLGLIHIYCGDGKGKTTASMGLAIRAAGNGLNVVVVQFLKNGTSSEFEILKTIKNITTCVCDVKGGFNYLHNEEDKRKYREEHLKNLKIAIDICNEGKCDLLVLDEILGAMSCDLLEQSILWDFLNDKNRKTEVVLTGRNPCEKLLEMADYVSEIQKVKHPYDKGIKARVGIEK